jgi:DNA-3-methyladenine glycosylase II
MKPTPAQLAAQAALVRLEPALKSIFKVIPARRVPRGRGQPYDSLISAIAHQQLHGNAAQAILNRLKLLAQGEYPDAKQMRALPMAKLRACGLSEAKALALKDLARVTIEGGVPNRQQLRHWDDERIIAQLTQVRGIGRWTVEMLLIFTLNRPDVLPVDDFGVRDGFRLLSQQAKQPTPKELKAWGERWAPYRTAMALLLWDIADFAKVHKTLPFGAQYAKICKGGSKKP